MSVQEYLNIHDIQCVLTIIFYINVFVHNFYTHNIIKAYITLTHKNCSKSALQSFCEVPNLDTILAQLDKEVGRKFVLGRPA